MENEKEERWRLAPDKITTLYAGDVTVRFWNKFGRRSHVYKVVDGDMEETEPMSVTTACSVINKPQLVPWACKCMEEKILETISEKGKLDREDIRQAKSHHNSVSKKAQDIGIMVHDWLENYAIGTQQVKLKDITLQRSVDFFIEWVKENDVKFVNSERLVYSRKHQYCGLIDVLFTMGATDHKVLYVGDYKTRGNIATYSSDRYQTSAYVSAISEEFSDTSGQIVIPSKTEGERAEFSGELSTTRYIFVINKDVPQFKAHALDDHDMDLSAFLNAQKIKIRENELK